MAAPYRLFGVESSPYTVKVRAVLRYRRLPHHWICRFPRWHEETQHVRPAVMPVIQMPDGRYRSDSTPILLDLERDRPGERSILPADPAHAFVARLIEDFADEWLTKCLFLLRFAQSRDGEYAARWVMSDTHAGSPDRDARAAAAREFQARQVGRMPLVGCTPENTALIEASYERLLDAMEPFVGNECFLFGTRPSLADFGLYGQLKTLATDLSAGERMRARAPYTEHWVRRLDDASGVDGEWADHRLDPSHPVWPLLQIVGDLYLPFLEANARALEAGEETLRIEVGGQPYAQPPFRYQQKCWHALRQALQDLPGSAREALRPALEATGCWRGLAA